MPRIRTVKPEFWCDEDLSDLSELAHMFGCALLNFCDDEGYFNANEKLLKAQIFPLRDPSLTIPVLIRELSEIGYLELFSGEKNKKYGRVVNFKKHQVINRPKPSKIKGLCIVTDQSVTSHGSVLAGKERKGKEQGKDLKDFDYLTDNPEPAPSDKIKKRVNKKNPRQFELFWKDMRETWSTIGDPPGAKSQAAIEFAKIKPGEELVGEMVRVAKIQVEEKQIYEEYTGDHQPMKHVCRWIKYSCWEDVPDLNKTREALNAKNNRPNGFNNRQAADDLQRSIEKAQREIYEEQQNANSINGEIFDDFSLERDEWSQGGVLVE